MFSHFPTGIKEQGMKQNQHRIPQMLLKQFASDRARRKIYEKNVHANTTPREVRISEAATELDAYSDVTEDKLQHIEDQASKVINRLVKAYRRRKTTGGSQDDLVVREDEKEPLARFFVPYLLRSKKAQMLRPLNENEEAQSEAEITAAHDAAITDDGLVEKHRNKEFHVLPVSSDGEYFILGGAGLPVCDDYRNERSPSGFFFPVSSCLCIAVVDPGNSWINEITELSDFVASLNASLCRMHVSPCVYGRTGELLNKAFNNNIRWHYFR